MKIPACITAASIMCLLSLNCGSPVIEGRVLVKGNEPVTFVVLQDVDGAEIVVTGPLEGEVRKHQYEKIKLKGTFLPGASSILPRRFEAEAIVP